MVYFCVASAKIYLYLWLSEKVVAKQLICGTRQATAKHRIQQMDSLVGSALPADENMTSWIFNSDRTTEKKLVEDMVTYLLDDVHTMDNAILQLINCEWPPLTLSMNTKTTVNHVKTRRLHDIWARYIHRMQDNDWVFWDDYYTDAGILDIPRPPETATSHSQHGIIKYRPSHARPPCHPTRNWHRRWTQSMHPSLMSPMTLPR